MWSALVDLIVLAALILAAIRYYRRGLIATAISAGSLVISLVVASAGYKLAGEGLTAITHLPASVSRLIAYALLLVIIQFILLLAARRFAKKLPAGLADAPGNLWGGVVLGVAQTGAVIGLALYLALGLLSPAQAAVIKSSYSGKLLLPVGKVLHDLINATPAEDAQDALRLITVDPESHQSVPLGFTVVAGRTDPQAESHVLDLVNRERTSRGLKPLVMNEKARAVARLHSQDMLARGYFSHDTPEGVDPFERMHRGGVTFLAAGENLALAPDADTAHKALMNSPGHKANILDTKFHTVGIGVIDAGRYGIMVTQDFTN